ncbi:MAG: DUF4292 domain-containing protein [Muribaculaceae bacterium]|nr:DUF4292 domain-containing protein [Muribaculaceae bacterium]
MPRNRISLIIALAIAVMSIAGCRSNKEAGTTRQATWTTFSAPVKIQLESPKKFSISGRATLVRDQSIYISLRMLGMEVGTVYVTPDSVFATEKLHRYILRESLTKVLDGRDIPFAELQDLLIGEQSAATAQLARAMNYSAVTDNSGHLTISASMQLKKTVAGKLIWDIDDARRDESSPAQWRRPSGYTEIPVSSVMKLLKTI